MAEEDNKDLNLEEGSAEVTLKDVYVMFYIMLKQSQTLKPGSKLSFPLSVFKNLPKNIKVDFQKKNGRLFAWIPEKTKVRKKTSKIIMPKNRIITLN